MNFYMLIGQLIPNLALPIEKLLEKLAFGQIFDSMPGTRGHF